MSRMIVLVLASFVFFGCAVEQSVKDNNSETKQVETAVRNAEKDSNESSADQNAAVTDNLQLLYFSEDLAEVEDLLVSAIAGESEEVKAKILGASSLAKIALLRLMKQDMAACMGVYTEYSKHKGIVKGILETLKIDGSLIGSASEGDLKALHSKAMAASGVFLALIKGKKEIFDKCLASAKDLYSELDLADLKEKFFPSVPVEVTDVKDHFKIISEMSCEETDEVSLTCVTNKDLICEVKSLLEKLDILAVKEKIATINFEEIRSCATENISK